MYHGKKKGVITPISSDTDEDIFQHPFFGMTADDSEQPIENIIDKLRGDHY